MLSSLNKILPFFLSEKKSSPKASVSPKAPVPAKAPVPLEAPAVPSLLSPDFKEKRAEAEAKFNAFKRGMELAEQGEQETQEK